MLVSQYETLLIFVVINLVLVYPIDSFFCIYFSSLILQSAKHINLFYFPIKIIILFFLALYHFLRIVTISKRKFSHEYTKFCVNSKKHETRISSSMLSISLSFQQSHAVYDSLLEQYNSLQI